MKIRWLRVAFAAIATLITPMALSSGVAFALAPYTCTWTGGGGNANFSTAANWSGCNSAAPQAADGDSLVFNNASSGQTLNNDISGLHIANILMQGSNTGSITLTGLAISLSGGITDTSSSFNNNINVPITLTASNQTFASSGHASDGFGALLTLGTNNITFNAGANAGGFFLSGGLAGSGTITANSTGAANSSSSLNTLLVQAGTSTYSGTINVTGTAMLVVDYSSGNPLGTATINIANGAAFVVQGSGDTATIPNTISVAGKGPLTYGAIESCLGLAQGCQNDNKDSTITFSGTVTLTGDTQVYNGNYFSAQTTTPANSATFNFASLTTNGHALTVQPNSNTILAGQAASASANAPGTPNTGVALASAHPAITLGVTMAAAATILGIARISNRKLSARTVRSRR